jgi:hypothetical protein
MMDETKAHLERHEAECAVRYDQLQGWVKSMDKRLWRLEALIMGSTIAMVVMATAVLVQLV